ncbi:MAG: hypothetical protein QNJ55_17450 [Xenococcus sp. MO_188.B8]|nr:hypothetical protein [Xenococcus sp. MO_188.B8]
MNKNELANSSRGNALLLALLIASLELSITIGEIEIRLNPNDSLNLPSVMEKVFTDSESP